MRKAVIHELICNFDLDYKVTETQFGIHFSDDFAAEITRLPPLADDGLIAMSTSGIRVLPAARLLVRRLCIEFEPTSIPPNCPAAASHVSSDHQTVATSRFLLITPNTQPPMAPAKPCSNSPGHSRAAAITQIPNT
jgi:hypothetical protein